MALPLALIAIGGFFKRYWKPIAIVVGVVVLVGGLFYSGVRYERNRQWRKDAKEVIKREREARKVKDEFDKVRKKVDESRDINPNDDDRDSCLFSSSDPSECT